MTKVEIQLPDELREQLSEMNKKLDALTQRLGAGEEYMTTAQVAEYFDVTIDTIRRRARQGILPCERPGGKNLRFRRADIIREG